MTFFYWFIATAVVLASYDLRLQEWNHQRHFARTESAFQVMVLLGKKQFPSLVAVFTSVCLEDNSHRY